MSDKTVDAIKIGKWSVGVHRRSGKAVMRFDFEDRPPVVLVASMAEAQKIGRALIDLDEPGVSSPAKPTN